MAKKYKQSFGPDRTVIYRGEESVRLGRFGVVNPGDTLVLNGFEYAYAKRNNPELYEDLNPSTTPTSPLPKQNESTGNSEQNPTQSIDLPIPEEGVLARDWSAETEESLVALNRDELVEIASALTEQNAKFVVKARTPKADLVTAILKEVSRLGWVEAETSEQEETEE